MVGDPTPDEWRQAFHAPSLPYRWENDERVKIIREGPAPPYVERTADGGYKTGARWAFLQALAVEPTKTPVTWHAEDEYVEDNIKRIARITEVVERFNGSVADVLANLFHYCKANQIDFNSALKQGWHFFCQETTF
jgi:hypothetical protein